MAGWNRSALEYEQTSIEPYCYVAETLQRYAESPICSCPYWVQHSSVASTEEGIVTRKLAARPVTQDVEARTPQPLVGHDEEAVSRIAIAPETPDENLSTRIAVAAYYLAERRNFAPGKELEDWLLAEQQVKTAAYPAAAK
jgi:hypothetical protein